MASSNSNISLMQVQAPHLYYAQQLNNSAAMCIEIGQFERAISSLQIGHKLLLNYQRKQKKDSGSLTAPDASSYCECYQCTLDGCVVFSESNPLVFNRDSVVSKSNTARRTVTATATAIAIIATNNNSNGNKKRKVASSNVLDDDETSKKHKSVCSRSIRRSIGYVYRRPVRVPPQSLLKKNHYNSMGSTLNLIIVFNLAIAHHQKALGSNTCTADNILVREESIEKTRCLYEFILLKLQQSRLHLNTVNGNNNDNCIRFNMIIHNNLS